MKRLEVDIRRRLPGGTVLDFTFTVEDRITAIFGPSGAGKTSLLLALAGLLQPDEGTIRWGDRLLYDSGSNICVPPQRRHIGVVFQDQRLFPHLTVGANLDYGASRRAAITPTIDRAELIDVLKLGELIDRRPATLSGGEAQRVALGRALLAAPELLLLDEPLPGVDERQRLVIFRYLERAIDHFAIPVVYISHHRLEVVRFADRVVVLSDGRVQAIVSPSKLQGGSMPLTKGEERDHLHPMNLLRLADPRSDGESGWLAVVPGLSTETTVRVDADEKPGSRDALWVTFSAKDVVLASDDGSLQVGSPLLSVRNRLPGVVINLARQGPRVHVAVAVAAQVIWATVTPGAATELGLERGTPVLCLVKTAALRPLD